MAVAGNTGTPQRTPRLRLDTYIRNVEHNNSNKLSCVNSISCEHQVIPSPGRGRARVGVERRIVLGGSTPILSPFQGEGIEERTASNIGSSGQFVGGCEPVRAWVPVDLWITSLLPTGPTGQAGDLWTTSLLPAGTPSPTGNVMIERQGEPGGSV